MLYFTLEDDSFTQALTHLEFGSAGVAFDERLFGSDPEVRLLAHHAEAFEDRDLLLEPHTGSWCILERTERKVLAAMDGRTLASASEAYPEADFGELRDFVARLYWRGLLAVNHRTFLEAEVVTQGPIFTPAPLFLIVPTERCNMACKYCCAHSGPSRDGAMSWETAKKVVDLIVKYPATSLTVEFAGGEALLEPALIRRTVVYAEERAAKADKAIQFLMQTNATLVTPKLARLLKDLGISAGVSLDGNESTNDLTRIFPGNRGTYQRIARGISLLEDAEVPFGLICVVSKLNHHRLPDILEHLKSLGFDSVKLNPVFYLGRARDAWETLELAPEEYLATHVAYLRSLVEDEEPVLDENTVYMIKNLGTRMRQYRCMRSQCGAGREFFTFAPNGDIYPCSRYRTHSELALGNVASIDSLVGLADSHGIMAGLAERTAETVEQCRRCLYKRFCEAGCALDSYTVSGITRSAHPWCEYYRGMYTAIFAALSRGSEVVVRTCPGAHVFEQNYFLNIA